MVAAASFLDRVVDILTSNLPPKQLMEIKATTDEKERLAFLMNKVKNTTISHEEEEELNAILFAEHLMVMAKAKAFEQIRSA